MCVRASVRPELDLSNHWTDQSVSGVISCRITLGRCTYSLIFKILIFDEIMEKKLRNFYTFFSFSSQNSISTEWIDAFLVSYHAEWSGADMCVDLLSKFWILMKLWEKNLEFFSNFFLFRDRTPYLLKGFMLFWCYIMQNDQG